ncbi:phage tail tape measure protein, partial [Zavarzinella formosa]|uniref:hypothetical protein n=1 Tax=Zavarzinella formosa TaxID=360055 RepID=UPI0005930A13
MSLRWFMSPVGVRCFLAAQGGGGGGSSAIRAGSAFVELFVKNNLLYRGLDAARGRVKAFGDFLARLGGASLGFKTLLSPLQSAVDQLAETSKQGDIAAAFGLTAESATRLFGVMKAVGSDTRDATEGLVTLGQRVKDALSGSSQEANQLFDSLGVGAEQFEGLDPAKQFYLMIDSLKKVQDPATRVQLLLKAFGEDTGKNLISTLALSQEEMARLGDTFEMSAADMEDARKASREFTVASATLGRIWQSLAVAVAPVVSEFSAAFSDVAKEAIGFVREYRPLVGLVLKGAVAFAGAGAALVVIGQVVSMTAGAVGLLASGV